MEELPNYVVLSDFLVCMVMKAKGLRGAGEMGRGICQSRVSGESSKAPERERRPMAIRNLGRGSSSRGDEGRTAGMSKKADLIEKKRYLRSTRRYESPSTRRSWAVNSKSGDRSLSRYSGRDWSRERDRKDCDILMISQPVGMRCS